MAQYTPNLGLYKPNRNDAEEVDVTLSENFTKIDEVLADIAYNVKSFGAKGDGVTDDSPAIQYVITNKITSEGTLQFDNGTYHLASDIDFEGKSIKVVASEKAEFTGVGKFPTFATNPFHQRNGNHTKIKPKQGRTDGGYLVYGDSAFSAEVEPENTYVGNAVGGFFSAKSGQSKGGLWALNAIAKVDEGYTGFVTACEIDLDNFSADTQRTTVLGLTGQGTQNVSVGISVERADETQYVYGIDVRNSQSGINVEQASDVGYVAQSPTNVGYFVTGAGLQGILVASCPTGIEIDGATKGISIRNTDANGVGIEVASGGIQLGGGSPIKYANRFVQMLTFPSIPAQSTTEISFAATGVTGDAVVSVSPNSDPGSGLIWSARALNGSIRVRLANVTASAITPAEVPWLIQVIQP